MKREGISTLFIHGFPWALSYLLDRFLFVWKCSLCGFWKYFVKMPLFRKSFVMILVFIRMYTKCWTFEQISCFQSVWCVFVLKVSKQLRSFLPTQKSFVHFSFILILLPYHWLVKSLIFGCKGTGMGHHIVMIAISNGK